MEIIAILLGVGLLAALLGTDDDIGEADPTVNREGTDGPDNLVGGTGDDLLSGGAGFDDLNGRAGDDRLFGGAGQDLIEGGAGNDVAFGGEWNDGLFGGAGNDQLRGDLGNDLVVGADGNDVLRGNAGDDELYGGDGFDILEGGDGDDLLMGSALLNRDLTPEEFDMFRDGTIPRDEDGAPILDNFGLTGRDTDTEADQLNGGAGYNFVVLGNNDTAFSTDGGENDYVLGDWIQSSSPARIESFDSTRDLIVVTTQDPEALVEFTTLPDDPEGGTVIEITIDGRVIATVQGTFDSLDGPGADIVTTNYTPV